MDLFEKQLSSEYFYRGRIINMRRDKILLPDGNEAFREVVEHPGGVCVAALTDEGEILMVRQFRYPYGEVVLEVPAGKRETGESDPLIGAKRELLEETGATAERYFDLGRLYPTPGYTDEVIYMYGATGLTFGEASPDEDEFLTAERIPLERAVEMVMEGSVPDAKTQACILKLHYMMTHNEI
ncbi:MAG: NUDIX hydrolase [Clostridia bacterium]|nr:NUDIX hydrolase [Clostridia bacterium]